MPTRRLTPEDVLSFRNVEDPQISPDGSQVALAIHSSRTANGRSQQSGSSAPMRVSRDDSPADPAPIHCPAGRRTEVDWPSSPTDSLTDSVSCL